MNTIAKKVSSLIKKKTNASELEVLDLPDIGKKIGLKPLREEASLAEEYQPSGMMFAFAAKNGELCHPWAKCRDFLHDAVKARLTDSPFSIYGFSYDKNKNPLLDLDNMRMAVGKASSHPKDEFNTQMRAACKIINTLESIAGIAKEDRTVVFQTSGLTSKKKIACLFVGSNFWLKAPHLISLFALAIRLSEKKLDFNDRQGLFASLAEICKEFKDKDTVYIEGNLGKIEFTLENSKDIVPCNENGFSKFFFENTNNSNFHHSMGIVSFCNCKTAFPDLNSELIKKFKGVK